MKKELKKELEVSVDVFCDSFTDQEIRLICKLFGELMIITGFNMGMEYAANWILNQADGERVKEFAQNQAMSLRASKIDEGEGLSDIEYSAEEEKSLTERAQAVVREILEKRRMVREDA